MFKNNKKAQGMPINVIIIAALALIVLFVLIYIFTSQSGKTVSTLESCAGVGGRCTEEGRMCLDNEVEKTNSKCPKDTQKCCIKLFE